MNANQDEERKLDESENSADSSSEGNSEEGTGAETGTEGEGSSDNKDDEFKDLPFHQHPRWKERENEWNDRFEKQSRQFQTDLAEMKAANKPQDEKKEDVEELANGPIPKWFGAGQDTPEVRSMWKEYVQQQSKLLNRVAQDAETKTLERINQGRTAEERAVEDANKHFEASITRIEAKNGKRIDRNELLQYVLDNKIIDHDTQRWDYEKGYRWMMAEKANPSKNQGGTRNDRKQLADISTRGSGSGGGHEKNVTTSEDFKKPSNRPW